MRTRLKARLPLQNLTDGDPGPKMIVALRNATVLAERAQPNLFESNC